MFELSGSLRVTIGGETIDVTAAGTELTAEIARPRWVISNFGSLRSGQAAIRAVAERLYAAGLTLTVTRRGSPIARLGAKIPDTQVGRLFRIPHLALFPKPPSV